MDSDDVDLNQAEHEHISSALEVEQLEVNLFRSKSLWVPFRARGVFGGCDYFNRSWCTTL